MQASYKPALWCIPAEAEDPVDALTSAAVTSVHGLGAALAAPPPVVAGAVEVGTTEVVAVTAVGDVAATLATEALADDGAPPLAVLLLHAVRLSAAAPTATQATAAWPTFTLIMMIDPPGEGLPVPH